MNTKEIEIGLKYRISGDLANGHYADGTLRISHDDVVRVIKRITDTHDYESGFSFSYQP